MDRLLDARVVIPMSHDICLWLLRLYPSVPHHLMDEEGVLGDAHGVDNTTGTIVLFATMMRVGVRKDNLYTTRGDAGARARTFAPVVVPATHHLDSKLVHVVVVF